MRKNIFSTVKSKLNGVRKRKKLQKMKDGFHYFSNLSSLSDVEEIRFLNGSSMVTLKDSRCYWFNPLNGTASALFSLPLIGEFEKKETSITKKLITKGDTCIDVGANFGYYTVLMSLSVGDAGSVHAFEPLPHTYQILCDNVDLNKATNIKKNQLALDESSGKKEIYLPDIGISGSFKLHKYKKTYKKFKIDTITLDEYVEKNELKQVDFIKSDIEGAEILMLRGADYVLSKDKPILFLEVQERSTRLFGYLPKDLFNLLENYGYRSFYLKNNYLNELEVFHGLDENNFFFIPQSKIEKVKNIINEK